MRLQFILRIRLIWIVELYVVSKSSRHTSVSDQRRKNICERSVDFDKARSGGREKTNENF